MIKTYNKLVRDRIPEIIQRNGQNCRTRILTDEEYIAALDAKLLEECAEYKDSRSIEELADIFEVLCAMAACHGFSKEELISAQEKKHAERGGFENRIFLIDVREPYQAETE